MPDTMTEAELAVSKAGSAILLLAIMEPDKKRMVKVAATLQREHVVRFHDGPRNSRYVRRTNADSFA